MKFYVVILCICIVQICSGLNVDEEHIAEERSRWKEYISEHVSGASDQFMDDLIFVHENMKNNKYVREPLSHSILEVIWKQILKREKNAKMNAKKIEEFHSYLNEHMASNEDLARLIEDLKVIQLFLLKSGMPPDRYNGIMNLFYVLVYTKASSEEIESTLDYVYGRGTAEMKTPFVEHLPDQTAADCPNITERYSKSIDKLKTMVDLKPRVIEDVISIRDKFACNDKAIKFIENFEFLMTKSLPFSSRITESDIKFFRTGVNREDLKQTKSILLTRLPNKAFWGIMYFIKATDSNASTYQIGKALEYLYEDDSMCTCPGN